MAPIYSYSWSSSASSSTTTTTTTSKGGVKPAPALRFSYSSSAPAPSPWGYSSSPASSPGPFPPSPLSSPSLSSAGQGYYEREHEHDHHKHNNTLASSTLITDPRFTLPTPPSSSRASTPCPHSGPITSGSSSSTSYFCASNSSLAEKHHPAASFASPFLRLPPELRNQIYRYLLPTTIMIPGYTKKHAWLRGHTAILATNKQIHDEAAFEMYGNAMFELEVSWAGISFGYRWLLPSGLVPNRTYPFPEYISERYTRRIRKFDITVHHVDSYTGMVKYNYGGMGLTDGLRDQVAKLCGVLADSEQLQELHVKLIDGNCRGAWGDHRGQTVLEPLRELCGVTKVSISGSVKPDYAKTLKEDMETETCPAALSSPLSASSATPSTPTDGSMRRCRGRGRCKPVHIFNDDLACDVLEM